MHQRPPGLIRHLATDHYAARTACRQWPGGLLRPEVGFERRAVARVRRAVVAIDCLGMLVDTPYERRGTPASTLSGGRGAANA
jgi:hypothetical protein